MELQPNTLLRGGTYRIIRTLGRGGFGVTYLAEHVNMQVYVCIKEFFPTLYYYRADDSQTLLISDATKREFIAQHKAKFLKEARTIISIEHPNIVRILDSFEQNNTAYYVMEYIDGVSLAEYVRQCGRLEEREAIKYISEVASALRAVHTNNILHLDIKPLNIMIRAKDNRAILIDFGLAKHYDNSSGLETTSTPSGLSRFYAPFEMYTEGGVRSFTPSTDIYSLGATLYMLVTGTHPPQASEIIADGLPKLPNSLSRNVCETITRAMMVRRTDRPQSVDEFMGILTQSAHAKRSMTWLIWVLVLSILTLIGVVFFAYVMLSNTDSPQVEQTEQTQQTQQQIEPPQYEPGHGSYHAPEPEPIIYVNLPSGGFIRMVYVEGSGNIDSFYIAETELTQKQWYSVMGTTLYDEMQKTYYKVAKGESDNHPMYFLDYSDAVSFCDRLSMIMGKTFRLPTEQEWRYAAWGGKNGEKTAFSGSDTIDEVAWYSDNCSCTQTVARLAPNKLGLYDMTGNVWEWTCSCYDPELSNYYEVMVGCGGCWRHSDTSILNVSYRIEAKRTEKNDRSGMRLVMEIE